MTRLLLILLLPLSCVAQGFGSFSSDQPYLAQEFVSPPSPTDIPGLFYRWVAADLLTSNGQTNLAVTNWIDRIQSSPLTNGDAATRPINNNTNGVMFNGTSYLTNIVTITNTQGGPLSWFVVLNRTNGMPYEAYIFGTHNSYGFSLRNNENLFDGAWPDQLVYNDGTGLYHYAGLLPTNSIMDICFSGNTASDTNYAHCWTNGLWSGKVTVHPFSDGINLIGAQTLADSNWRFKGYLYEICIYTNYLTTNQIVGLHTYRTNTYGP